MAQAREQSASPLLKILFYYFIEHVLKKFIFYFLPLIDTTKLTLHKIHVVLTIGCQRYH
jgi:hypothetical protein